MAFLLLIASLAPSLGTLTMEVFFPVLGTWLLFQKTNDRFAPSVSFPAFYLLWLWVGSIPILPGSQSASIFNDFDDRQWLYYLIGFVAFFAGTLLILDRGDNVSRLRGLRVRWREGPLLLLFAAMAAGIAMAWLSITATEGIPIFKADVETLRVELPARHHLVYPVMVYLSGLLLPLIFLYLWTTARPRFRKTMYAFSAFIVFALISQGNRGLVLPSVLTIFALRHYLRKPWKASYMAIAAFVVLPLVSISGYYRSLEHFGPTYALDLANMGIPVPFQPFTNVYLYIRGPLDTFRNLMRLIPTTTPFQHGFLSFGFFLQVLPGHHPSSDFFFKTLLGHDFVGFGEPASLLGTFYADFGLAGIVVGTFLTGLLSKLVYLRIFRGSIGWLLTYCFLWQLLIGSMYGSLITYITQFLTPVAWLMITYALSGRVTRSDAS